MLGCVLHEPDLVNGTDVLLVDVALRDEVVPDDEQLVGRQVVSETADPELVGLFGEDRNDVVVLLVVLDDEVDAVPVEHLDEVNHLPRVVVEDAQEAFAVADHRQALLGEHGSLLDARLEGVELLVLFVQVEDYQLAGGGDDRAVAAGPVDGNVERRVLVGIDEGVYLLFVFGDVFDLRPFVDLVLVVAAGVTLGDVELEDLAVVGDCEEVPVGGFEDGVDDVVAAEADPEDRVERFVVLAGVLLLRVAQNQGRVCVACDQEVSGRSDVCYLTFAVLLHFQVQTAVLLIHSQDLDFGSLVDLDLTVRINLYKVYFLVEVFGLF